MSLGVGGTVVARARAILEVDTRAYDRGTKRAEAALVRWNRVAVKASLGIAAGFAIIGDKSVEAAKKFDASMELLKTQAGAGQDEVERMKKSVLGMAGSVATAPDELAAGLYHVESAGLRGSKALGVLEAAAKGAKIGQANLEDVTNALNATVVSGITGVHSYEEAMGVLNATVGAGDMRMQDLADAMGTGIAAKAKVFGLTIQEVSGALATLGDNNIRGAEAGTQLASAIRLLGAPSKASAKELADLGLKSTSLAEDMRQGGLVQALEDLKDRMDKAGLSASEQASKLARAFGGKQSGGILVLISQLERLKTKEDEIREKGKQFGDDWKAYQNQAEYATERLHAAAGALEIEIGQKLLPAFTGLVNAGTASVAFMNRHTTAAKIAVGVVGGLAAAILAVNLAYKVYKATLLAAARAQAALNLVMDANPIILITAAIVALGIALVVAYKKSATFRRIVNESFTVARKVVADAVNLITRELDLFLHGLQLLAEGASHLPFVGDKFRGVADAIQGARDKLNALDDEIRGTASRKIHVDVEVEEHFDQVRHAASVTRTGGPEAGGGGKHGGGERPTTTTAKTSGAKPDSKAADSVAAADRKAAAEAKAERDREKRDEARRQEQERRERARERAAAKHAAGLELPARLQLREAIERGKKGLVGDLRVAKAQRAWIQRRIRQGHATIAEMTDLYNRLADQKDRVASIEADIADKRKKGKAKGKRKTDSTSSDVAAQLSAARFGFLEDRQSFVSSLAGNMFAPGAAGVGGSGAPAGGGTTVVVNQTFPAPTTDKHREAMYARRAMRAAFEGA